MDNCKDCIYMANIHEQLKKSEELIKDLTIRVGVLEKNNAVDRKEMENFNKILEKIDKGISNIEQKIENLEKKPIAFWDKIISAVVGSAITFIVIEALKRMGG